VKKSMKSGWKDAKKLLRDRKGDTALREKERVRLSPGQGARGKKMSNDEGRGTRRCVGWKAEGGRVGAGGVKVGPTPRVLRPHGVWGGGGLWKKTDILANKSGRENRKR